MTRRLEPMDRVVELGDASVPYRFDVHTIAFVENAPELERRFIRSSLSIELIKKMSVKNFLGFLLRMFVTQWNPLMSIRSGTTT